MTAAFELVALLGVAATVAGLSSRFGKSAPLLLTLLGIVASFVPGVPAYELDPELVLVGILPPLLYTTAIRTPFVAIRRHRWAIGMMAIGLVLTTAAAVAVAARMVLPQLSWPAAIALGAVVAPPDAVAATAVARRIGLPRTMIDLLEGESLLNDATALVTLRTAVAAIAGGVTVVGMTGDFVRAVVVGIGVGWLLAVIVTPIRRRLSDPVLDTSMSLLVPYVAYLPAEELKGSGVLAVVVAGLMLGHRSPDIQSASSRATERTLFRTIQFLLESTVFLLIGLQLRRLLEAAHVSPLPNGHILVFCVVVCLTVLLVRPLWMFPVAYLPRLMPARYKVQAMPTWRGVTVVSWAGMRGVVTLAAAFGLPETEVRPTLVIAAFSVVAVTLLLQGATLPALVRALGVRGPDPAQDALQTALVLQKSLDAGQRRLLDEEQALAESGHPAPRGVIDGLAASSERIAHAVWERLATSDPGAESPGSLYRRLRLAMLQTERHVVVDVQRSGAVPAELLEGVLERLDSEEAMLSALKLDDVVGGDEVLTPTRAGGCEHLQQAPEVVVPTTPGVCQECAAAGRSDWVALRMCLTCGQVGCCDSSPDRHAEQHHRDTGHPVMRSVELGEAWRWCYLDHDLG